MDVRQGSSIPQAGEFQINASQVPVTPMKADFATSRPFCGNMQENQRAHANWPELQRISQEQHLGQVNQLELRNFLQETEAQNAAAYRDLTNSVSVSEYYNAWEAAVATKSKMCAESINMYNFSTENIDQLSTVSFGNLLALAHAAGSTSIAQNTNAETASTVNRPFNSLDSTPDAGVYHADGSSFCSRFPFNLNSPTRMTDAVFSSNTGLQFEPITPDKIKNKEKASDVSNLDINKVPIEGHMLSNEDTIKRAEADDRQENKEQSGVVLNQSESENHKPDKLGEHDAELNNTPQQKPRRKKHRPKVVIEGQPKRTPRPKNTQQHGSEENKKRKYVRRNVVEQPPGTPSDEINYMTGHEGQPPTSRETSKARRKYVSRNQADNVVPSDAKEGTNGTIDPPKVSRPKRTCRRSLIFNVESQLSDQNSSFWESSTAEDVHANQAQSTSQHQMQDPDPSTLKKIGLNHGKSTMGQNEISRGKCKIIFLDETHDKQACQASILEMTPRSPNSSNCSSTACLSQQTQEQALKSQQPCGTDEAKLNCTNDRGAHVNSVQAYQAILPVNEPYIHRTQGMHFPAIYKKKRTEKGHSSATSYTQPLTCETNYVPLTRCNVGLYPTGTSANDKGNNRMQNSKFIPAFVEAEMLRKKRSKAVTKGRDFASLDEICKHFSTSQATISGCGERYETSHQPTTCIEALVSDTRATMKTKKRSKRSILASSTASDMYVRHNFATNARGLLPAITWSGMSPVDEIAERLQHLDLNRERRQDQYRLITYQNKFQAENALVLYRRDGSIVPFGGSFVKKRKPRPRVDLDDETNRVWKLLLQDINSEGIDGTDEDKAKWWEEERGVFSGRADSFVARMRLVQGDRRFSPWKGSVVDSVVGVFLTQNVSDHLSSSAFMSLAARFPLTSKSSTEKHEQRTEIIIEEPEVSGVDPDDTITWHGDKSNQPTLDQNSLKISSTDSSEETAAINSSESSENSTNCIMSTENFIAQQPDSSSREGSDVYHESTVYKLARTSQIAATSFLGNQIQLEPDNLHSSQDSVVSSQNSVGFSGVQASERNESSNFCGSTSFWKLLEMAGTPALNGDQDQRSKNISPQLNVDGQLQHGTHCSQVKKDEEENHKISLEDVSPCSYSGSCPMPNLGAEGTRCNEDLQEDGKFPDICRELGAPEQIETLAESADQAMNGKMTRMETNSCNDHQNKVDTAIIGDPEVNVEKKNQIEEDNCNVLRVPDAPTFSETIVDDREEVSIVVDSCKSEHKAVELHTNNENNHVGSTLDRANDNPSKAKNGRTGKEKQHVDWDSLRLQAQTNGNIREKTVNTMDSLDYEAVRCADVNEIAHTIRERGMNNMLAERIKDFLNRIVREHGSIDLEWLRDVPPDKAKEYLLSIRGLGLKSVECVRLLTLHHLAFPVDTNVGRIAVRLGWVPLQPLPESLQLHLLELYPILESIQKYLWPRLCKLDQETLYELHYHMITFGKVFCTKSKPNCNACPLRGECRHFASAFASARLGLPAPEEKSIVTATENKAADQNQFHNFSQLPLMLPQADQTPVEPHNLINSAPIIEVPATPEPIIEVPTTPESEPIAPEIDIEDAFSEDPNEIPMIKLNMVEFTQNVKNFVENNMELHQVEMSKALVALTPEAASIPTPKLKNISRLRTEHQVYELPDSHPLLKGLDKREPDDPCSYLLAIWTPGETADSIDPPERQCNSQESGGLCDDETCFACNSIREAHTQTVRGTLLIPCRTAMRGSFPLNGTYFQVNEVFADHDSSLSPIDVPRHWLWNLPRRTVYFGTSIPTIFKGQNTESIQHCFWRGFVCVRGFDQKTRAPRPLMARLHFPASKLTKTKGKPEEN